MACTLSLVYQSDSLRGHMARSPGQQKYEHRATCSAFQDVDTTRNTGTPKGTLRAENKRPENPELTSGAACSPASSCSLGFRVAYLTLLPRHRGRTALSSVALIIAKRAFSF